MHDLTAAFRVADRILLLSEGKLLLHGAKEELTEHLQEHFGVRCYQTEDGPVFV